MRQAWCSPGTIASNMRPSGLLAFETLVPRCNSRHGLGKAGVGLWYKHPSLPFLLFSGVVPVVSFVPSCCYSQVALPSHTCRNYLRVDVPMRCFTTTTSNPCTLAEYKTGRARFCKHMPAMLHFASCETQQTIILLLLFLVCRHL
jgi:hypothetical protein